MILVKRNFVFTLSFILSIAFFLPAVSDVRALELSGMLAITDVADSFRVDFTRLDTPTCAIGMRRDTVKDPDMILIHAYGQYPVLFLLRAPYTPGSDSMSINTDRFSGSSMPSNIDSLRKKFLPIAASVNPQCRQSGQCDTTGGGFFVRTSETGVAFCRPCGIYIGGIDRYYLFWAYSSDGTFGGNTAIKPEPANIRLNTLSSQEGTALSLFDLQGRRLGREMIKIVNKSPCRTVPFIIKNDISGQAKISIRVESR